MADIRIIDTSKTSDINQIKTELSTAFQSARINFLLGSGASLPAISVAGNIEKEIEELFTNGEIEQANEKMYEFLSGIQTPNNQLLAKVDTNENSQVVENYRNLLQIVEKILIDRKTSLLAKQANIFTTNYDLFIEKSAERLSTLWLNDGFQRTPNLEGKFIYSPQYFFNSIYNVGTNYSYQIQIPVVNLIKIHGSLSWERNGGEIHCRFMQRDTLASPTTADQIVAYNNQFAVVRPQKTKFQETVLDRFYYDLLRLYSNELDTNNTLLLVFGFSFEDDHICDITRRALKNPTLKLVIFSYSNAGIESFKQKFDGFNNVQVIAPSEDKNIDFTIFNSFIGNLPIKE